MNIQEIRRHPERGAVTVEGAIALAGLTTMFGLILSGVTAVSDQLRCADAAREAARLVARGDQPLAEAAVRRIAPRGARLTVALNGEQVTAEVNAEPIAGLVSGIHLRGIAYTVLEPGATDEGRWLCRRSGDCLGRWR